MIWLACRERKICRCPASWPGKPGLGDHDPHEPPAASCHHESPITAKTAHPAASSTAGRVIFQA